ncbi:hypothetical protein BY996DRAFT_2431704 [Phakopsora pachyrhizi]|nr:hypothetical protein BY996DRAFT_2431704 [Phakopsora pachyrhizi]
MTRSKQAVPCLYRSTEHGVLMLTPTSGRTMQVSTENAVWVIDYLQPFLYRLPYHSGPVPEIPFRYEFKSISSPNKPIGVSTNPWIATITILPIGEVIPRGKNVFTSDLMPNKQDAKKAVALKLCEALHDYNLPYQPATAKDYSYLKSQTQPEEINFVDGNITASNQSGNSDFYPSSSNPDHDSNYIKTDSHNSSLTSYNFIVARASDQIPKKINQKSPLPLADPLNLVLNLTIQHDRDERCTSCPPKCESVTDSHEFNEDQSATVDLSCPYPFGDLSSIDYRHSGGHRTVFLHRLSLQLLPPQSQSCSLGLLCAFDLCAQGLNRLVNHTINGISFSFKIEEVMNLNWSREERETRFRKLAAFTRLATQVVICQKFYEGEMAQYLAPLRLDGTIDWNLVETPLKSIQKISDLQIDRSQLIVCPHESVKFRLFSFLGSEYAITRNTRLSELLKKKPKLSEFLKSSNNLELVGQFLLQELRFSNPEVLESPLVYLRSLFKLDNNSVQKIITDSSDEKAYEAMLPLFSLKFSQLSLSFWRSVAFLPFIIRSIQEQIFANKVTKELQLNIFPSNDLILSLTPPGYGISPNNQTLEIIGDSFLKLASTIHLYYAHPTLEPSFLIDLLTSKETSLHQKFQASKPIFYILAEEFRPLNRFILAPAKKNDLSPDGSILRQRFSRLALSKVAKAIVGAAYVSGGLEDALKAGSRLGLLIGGSELWSDRDFLAVIQITQPSSIQSKIGLQETLGYSFKNNSLLTRALTHRSASKGLMTCYERDELLGGSLLRLGIAQNLYRRLNSNHPAKLDSILSDLTSNSCLGYIALRKLELQPLIVNQLHDFSLQTQEIFKSLANFVTFESFFENFSKNFFDSSELVEILAGVLKSIIGAIFIDSGNQISTVYEVLDSIFDEAIVILCQGQLDPKLDRKETSIDSRNIPRLDSKVETFCLKKLNEDSESLKQPTIKEYGLNLLQESSSKRLKGDDRFVRENTSRNSVDEVESLGGIDEIDLGKEVEDDTKKIVNN